MPAQSPSQADASARIVRELTQLSPIPLTKLDVAEELRLPQKITTELLEHLVRQGVIASRPGFNNRQNRLYYAPEAA